MGENQWLADRFEEHQPHLRSVAYRMPGTLTEADDAVPDTRLRLSRAGAGEVENLGGWLTTIVSRVCLNMLRSRKVSTRSPVPNASEGSPRLFLAANSTEDESLRSRQANRPRSPLLSNRQGIDPSPLPTLRRIVL
jgi:DNA-directed RNA polymerase specialized sigma24 family protein